MPLTSKQILDLAGRSGSTARGAALFGKFNNRSGALPNDNTAAQNRFLDAYSAAQVHREQSRPRPYAHPESGDPYVRKTGPLSAAELAWINRLPQDPEKVSYADARVLAGIAKTIGRTENPGDALILDQVWKPVKEFHDRNAAAVRLERAKASAPTIPDTAYSALIDALRAENPGLHEVAVRALASEQLKETREQNAAARGAEIEAAEEAAMAIDARTYSRTAVTL